jgi:hypothetical protein
MKSKLEVRFRGKERSVSRPGRYDCAAISVFRERRPLPDSLIYNGLLESSLPPIETNVSGVVGLQLIVQLF